MVLERDFQVLNCKFDNIETKHIFSLIISVLIEQAVSSLKRLISLYLKGFSLFFPDFRPRNMSNGKIKIETDSV